MNHDEHVKLLFGPYRMPRCKVGGWLTCQIRGKVKIAGIMDAPLQWPFWLRGGHGRPMLIVCGGLVRAVERESATAIGHWFGVSLTTVTAWRHALGVARFNAGSMELARRLWPEKMTEEAVHKRMESLKSPERGRKISEARKGHPTSEKTKRVLARKMRGKKHTEEARRKMREAHARNRLIGASFDPEMVAMLWTMTNEEVAEQTGLTEACVRSRRHVLGIPQPRK